VRTFSGCQWLTPVILATQEAEIRRITVGSKPSQIYHGTLSQKTLLKNKTGGVVQAEALSSSSSTEKNVRTLKPS
jgi:hypothetical protein